MCIRLVIIVHGGRHSRRELHIGLFASPFYRLTDVVCSRTRAPYFMIDDSDLDLTDTIAV